MERPTSIVQFERCYLGAVALGLVNTLIHWQLTQNVPQVAQANAMIGSWYMPAISALGILIPLLLWYFAARRASVVAKWIIVVFAGFGLLGAFLAILMGSYLSPLSAIFSLAGLILNLIAAALLFRLDSRRWFGEVAA